ncbi:hypothetical protein DC366_11160 [Pelagivirga sediminicola]|uniref:Uncharacterized protein n=1 Tax=Pelagivirga sediminicola TaxID=2170575 RepID=A0A2T7G747_9RHOB|nr:hypothetical protein DC366_11160 [Pelagivirga sediminicola]
MQIVMHNVMQKTYLILESPKLLRQIKDLRDDMFGKWRTEEVRQFRGISLYIQDVPWDTHALYCPIETNGLG